MQRLKRLWLQTFHPQRFSGAVIAWWTITCHLLAICGQATWPLAMSAMQFSASAKQNAVANLRLSRSVLPLLLFYSEIYCFFGQSTVLGFFFDNLWNRLFFCILIWKKVVSSFREEQKKNQTFLVGRFYSGYAYINFSSSSPVFSPHFNHF